jgi:cell filamentation protein
MSVSFTDTYVYPDTSTLKNKLGLRDAKALAVVEYAATASRAEELNAKPITGKFDLAHMQAIHGYLFQDVFDWAGQTRVVNISKGGSSFAHVDRLESFAAQIARDIAKDKYLKGLNKDAFVERLTHHYGNINALHPFREGNGRTTRHLLGTLASEAGYTLDRSKIDNSRGQWNDASRQSMQGNDQAIGAILREAIRPTRAIAFEQHPQQQALAAHPELASAYGRLAALSEDVKRKHANNPTAQAHFIAQAKNEILRLLDTGTTEMGGPQPTGIVATRLLDDATHRQVYRDQVLPYIVREASPSPSPRVIMVGGQPGAGKSVALQHAGASLIRDGGSYAVLNGDELRRFHPLYADLVKTDKASAADKTHADVGLWVEQGLKDAAERKLNVLIETTLRQPNKVAETVAAFKAKGFAVELRVVITHPEQSLQSIYDRFAHGLTDSRSVPQFTPHAFHEAALNGMAPSLDAVAKEVTRTVFVNRAGTTLFDSDTDKGQPSAALAELRQAALPAKDLARITERWTELRIALTRNVINIPEAVRAGVRTNEARLHQLAAHNPEGRSELDTRLGSRALENSRAVASMLLRAEGLSAGSPSDLRGIRGEVVAVTSHHVAIKVSAERGEMVGLNHFEHIPKVAERVEFGAEKQVSAERTPQGRER